MNKTKAKRKLVGYSVHIFNGTLQVWDRVGFLFSNKLEANNYRKSKHPNANAKVQGIRVSAEPIEVRESK